MEAISLDKKIDMIISKEIQMDNIVNACVKKYHSDKTTDSTHKREFFQKCVESKVQVYNTINQNYIKI